MRNIKFRAWDGEGMQYGGFAIHATGGVYEPVFPSLAQAHVMQFTGLTDKNGKDIYEGDVVRGGGEYGPWTIEWYRDGWRLKDGARLHDAQPENHLEVIGNIYENPSLLTV